jgi:hypothetical protein
MEAMRGAVRKLGRVAPLPEANSEACDHGGLAVGRHQPSVLAGLGRLDGREEIRMDGEVQRDALLRMVFVLVLNVFDPA